jgi:hypothetical protein
MEQQEHTSSSPAGRPTARSGTPSRRETQQQEPPDSSTREDEPGERRAAASHERSTSKITGTSEEDPIERNSPYRSNPGDRTDREEEKAHTSPGKTMMMKGPNCGQGRNVSHL